MRTTFALLVALALPLLPLGAQQREAPAAAHGELPGLLGYHVRQKAELAALPEAERRARFVAHGWRPENVDRETVALYTTGPLVGAERAALEELGVALRELWIPPVPGRHPHGFHIATVPHARVHDVLAIASVVRMATLENVYRPAANDVTPGVVDLSWIHAGKCGPGFDGSGVRVAVADSGFDLAHGDFGVPFEQFDMSEGDSPATWSTNVANTVIGHGTHVLGVLAGNGALSGGKYRGVAPGVDLALYKIGEDDSGIAFNDTIITALARAATVGCRVLNLSYNGIDIYMDGSQVLCHAIDAVKAQGLLVVVAAGNEGDNYDHGEVTVPANGSGVIEWIANNTTGAWGSGHWLNFMLLWRDDVPGDHDLEVTVDNLGSGEGFVHALYETSSRGTEMQMVSVFMAPPAGSMKTYVFRITDHSAAGGATTRAHLWDRTQFSGFAHWMPGVTVLDPGVADGAIAVGAWTHRKLWHDLDGTAWWWDNLTEGEVPTFSSQGPRIDGVLKPEFVAPGAVTITTRDVAFTSDPIYMVDDDGVYGVGPASYWATWGTSYTAPVVAGAAVLLFQADPTATVDEVVAALMSTTSENAGTGAGTQEQLGAGLIDVYAALHAIGAAPQCPALVASTPVVSLSAGGAVDLFLNGGPALDGQVHWVLGSATGTSPGLPLGLVNLPLNGPDPYFDLLLAHPNSALFQGTLGVLADDGRSSSRIVYPPLPAPLAGLVLNHAYVALHVPTLTPIFASNAAPVLFVP